MSRYNPQAVKLYEKARSLHQQGKLANSALAYRKAIKISPNFLEAYNNLGNVLLEQNKLKEATAAYRKALKVSPEHPILLNNLGNVLHLQGGFEKAETALRKAIHSNPEYADAHSNLGNTLVSLNKTNEAISFYKKAISLNPINADTACNLAHALQISDKLEEAKTYYQLAIKNDDSNLSAQIGLGNLQIQTENFNNAYLTFEHVLEKDPDNTEALLGLANLFAIQGKTGQAIRIYQQIIEITPNNKLAHKELANAYKELGEIKKSIEHYTAALNIDPGYCAAHRLLAHTKKHSKEAPELRAMESLYQSSIITDEDRMHLCFGLATCYENIKNHSESFKFLLEGNKLKRSTYHYNTFDDREYFNKLMLFFSDEFFRKHDNIGYPDPTPIFIVGMPRSGTSLVEQILSSHPDVYGAGELTKINHITSKIKDDDKAKTFPDNLARLTNDNFYELGKYYIDEIRQYSKNAEYITDKMPQNFLRIGFIKTILPNAKVIYCSRNPLDNCLSIFKNYFSAQHKYAYQLKELGEYYNLHLNLMVYWHKVLPGFVYNITYENLVDNTKKEIQNLLEFCKLQWNDNCLEFYKTKRTVSTISNVQVRSPIYKNSINLWENYNQELQPLKEILENIKK